MTQVKQVKLEPGALDLFGGPHQEPFGTLTAEALDDAGRSATGASFEWSASSRDLQIEPQPGNPSRARVGSYRPCSATVTVRELASGLSARSKVTVNILDAGPPRPSSGRSILLSSVIESLRVMGGANGAFLEGVLPRGSGRAPRPASFSLEARPGESFHLDVRLAELASRVLMGAAGLCGHFDLDLTPESGRERLILQLRVAPRVEVASVNLEFVTLGAEGLSEPSTPVYVEIEHKHL